MTLETNKAIIIKRIEKGHRMKYFYFGSAFNPPHLGHAVSISGLINDNNVIYVGACKGHAFGKEMIDLSHRKQMAKLWINDLFSGKNVFYSEIEEEFDKDIVYSFDVLNKFKDQGKQVTLIIGPDNEANWPRFFKYKEIDEMFGKVVTKEELGIRSTMCRNEASKDNHLKLKSMVTPSVYQYIMDNYLYKE